MGLLALSLLFVGATLVTNGICRICKIDAKSTSALNLITGFVLVSGNLIALTKAAEIVDYINVASGFLFGFTYIFIFANNAFSLDLRPFGLYSFFATIYAVTMGIVSTCGGDAKFAFLWFAWAVLWFSGTAEINFNWKISKIAPYIVIAVGIFAAFIPAMMMFLSIW